MATSTKRTPRDTSPKWDGHEAWNAEQFLKNFHLSMDYYRLESSIKELKPKLVEWMHQVNFSKSEIDAVRKTKDKYFNGTIVGMAANLVKGMPVVRADFNKGRNSEEWVREQIADVIELGKNDIDDDETVVVVKTPTQVYNIQDRIREQAGQMSEEIDYAIDAWITDPEEFDPKAFKMVSLLRGKGAKAAQARYIKGFFANGLAELQELASGNADEQLREGYKFASRKNIKKLIEFYESIAQACEQIAAEAKVMKKPRAKKSKPAEDLVKKLKFKAIDDKLGIVSVPPAGLIGAQMAVVYNTKTRKIGLYISTSSAGLGVKGTSITQFTEKSFQKTLRKPAEQLKEFKEQNTQKRVETWFTKNIKTTETMCNGRMSEDIVLLKVYK